MKSLRTMTGGGMENVRELLENKLRFAQKKTRVEERLVQILHTDLAVAMAGRKLLSRVRDAIQGEVMRSQWLAGKEQTREGLPTIIAGLGERTILLSLHRFLRHNFQFSVSG